MKSGARRDREPTARPSDEAEGRRRVLYWWTVPERPGTGASMLKIAGSWFAIVVALVILFGVIL